MTDAVKRALMGLAKEDYMKMVEEHKKQERELEAEVKRLKDERKRKTDKQHNNAPEGNEHAKMHDTE